MTGVFENYAIFDSITINSGGGYNAFIAKISDNTVSITEPNPTGNSSINIFPNPNTSTFAIESELPKAELKIYDVTGRLAYTTTLNSKHQALNPNLSAGIYFVKVSEVEDSPRRGENVFTQKLVIE